MGARNTADFLIHTKNRNGVNMMEAEGVEVNKNTTWQIVKRFFFEKACVHLKVAKLLNNL